MGCGLVIGRVFFVIVNILFMVRGLFNIFYFLEKYFWFNRFSVFILLVYYIVDWFLFIYKW